MSISQLRVVTYLCPSIPVELFQGILEVLEEHTGYPTTLQYEWRSDGPAEDRPDPFQSNLADLAFMPASGYIILENKKNAFAELLPVTPIFKHPKNDVESNGTYVDIILHADKLKHNITEMLDLRGCRWACSHENSLANYVTMNMLREMGENVSFFGMTHRSSSHLESVNMVLNKKVDAAAIDAATLTCNKKLLHNGAKDVVVLTSYGPFSPYAVVINSRISSSLKQKIIEAFSKMNSESIKFEKFGLLRFTVNQPEAFKVERQLVKSVASKMGKVPYY